MYECNILAGWGGMILGALLGMAYGLRAESREWAGGYGSFRRQALRLAHIAAFALGMINVLYGSSTRGLDLLPPRAVFIGSRDDDRRRTAHAGGLPGRRLAPPAETPLPTARKLRPGGAFDPGLGLVAAGVVISGG